MDLNQITVPSLNLAKAVPFYEKLGLVLIVKSLPHYARFECPNGTATLSLHQTDERSKGLGIWMYFECENLDHQVELLKQKGIEFEADPEDQNWLWREARLKDLDGNQIILYHAGENRRNPPWRIESTS